MKSAGKTIALVFLVFLAACAGPQKIFPPPYVPAKTDVSTKWKPSSYNSAIEKLGDSLAGELNRLGEGQGYGYGSEKKSFFIYNADVHEGEERELAKRFIEDLGSLLINKKIKIKRKELVTWGRATKGQEAFKIECREVLENLASDFLIEFSLKECPESANCLGAGVRVIARETNDIVFTAKESFSLTGNVANWYHQKHKLPRVKGSRENPYSDYREAANYMVGRLSCIAKSMMPDDDTMHILVARTKNTPSDVALAFSETVSFYGLEQVIVSEWLPVVISAGDRFELDIYRGEHRELFETANLVLALDVKDAEKGNLFLKAHLLALRSMEIIKDGKRRTLGAGMAMPYCVSSGYASSGIFGKTISATGVGICNRTLDSAIWRESAKKAAELDAKKNLAKKVREKIHGTEIACQQMLDRNRVESTVHAYISGARVVRERYDEKTCKAVVKLEVEQGNVFSLLEKSLYDDRTSLAVTTLVKSIKKRVSQPSYRQVQSTQRTGNARVPYQRAQSAMLRDLESNIRGRLLQYEISPAVVNLISITGSLDLPDCRKENHYLSPESVPSRHYCSLNYDLKLVMRNKELFCCRSRVRGMGSNRNTAWEDALLGVVDNLYPLVSDVALAVSEKKTLKDLRKTLLSLDESLWQVSDNFDVGSVLDFVERQIEDLR